MEHPFKEQEGGSPSLSDAIDQILAHPEVISMVASVLNAPRPADPGEAEARQEPAQTSAPPSSDALAPVLSRLSQLTASPGGESRTRSDLLCALKPYLSPGRREAIDYMIRISQITDLMKHLS